MKDNELQIIEKLTGVSPDKVKLADDGFWSRGYIIDDGCIVFKFKKSPNVSYKTEIKALDFINSLILGINVQKVGWVAPNDTYLGIYDVKGKSLEDINYDYKIVGCQLATALRELHRSHPEGAEVMTQNEEISAWQERYRKSHDKLLRYFFRSRNCPVR